MRINLPGIPMRCIQPKPFALFWVMCATVYAIVFVGSEFAGSPVAGAKGLISLLMQWVVVGSAAAALIGLMAVNRWIFAVCFPILTGASTIAAYFRLTLGLSLTPTLIDLTVTNDMSTWASVITPQLIMLTIAGLGLGLAAALFRFRHVAPPRHPLVWAAGFLIAAMAPVSFIPRFKAPVIARIPYSFYYACSDYLTNRRAIAENRTTFDRIPATAPSDAPTVVFVIGESLRPDHLQLNGYGRPTTPSLSADTAVVSLPKMRTDQLYTHVSVPHIVSRADSLNPDIAYSEQSFISLFRKAGYRTAWLSNQDEVETYAYFMHEADTLVRCNGARSLYAYDKWLDTDLLPAFDDFMQGNGGKKLAVIHTIGSHWWYRSHYPDSLAVFQPEINSRIVSELTQEQMVNSYDNTILATDMFLARLIGRLRGLNAVLIFISDHGEALGENGNYLHGDDYEELHPTACFVWYSSEFARRYPEKTAALRNNAGRPMLTDVMFHSVLDAASISTQVLDPSQSIFTSR